MATYPQAFTERLQQQLGEEFSTFLSTLDGPSPVSVRRNPFKGKNLFDGEEPVSWCPQAVYLKERPVFTLDPLLHAGSYYVQEASSMFVEQAWQHMEKSGPLLVLDLCAAPGGKSTHLLSLMSEEDVLVSNEPIPNRNKILRENLVKWGYANYLVTQNEAPDFVKTGVQFDVVLIDAPCSGEGLFRKDKNAIAEWSEKNVEMCAARQHDILQAIRDCIKPGGYLIYSTCTYEPAENDAHIKQLINEGWQLQLPFSDVTHGLVFTGYGYQFYPHKVKGEGFYLSLLRKPVDDSISSSLKPVAPSKAAKYLSQYLAQPQHFVELRRGENWFALPCTVAPYFNLFATKLQVKQAGLLLGEEKAGELLPAHQIALYNGVRADLPAVELDYEDAIRYLKCETIKAEGPKGWHLVRYRGTNLGWVKLLPNRVNNYYPREWRILMR